MDDGKNAFEGELQSEEARNSSGAPKVASVMHRRMRRRQKTTIIKVSRVKVPDLHDVEPMPKAQDSVATSSNRVGLWLDTPESILTSHICIIDS